MLKKSLENETKMYASKSDSISQQDCEEWPHEKFMQAMRMGMSPETVQTEGDNLECLTESQNFAPTREPVELELFTSLQTKVNKEEVLNNLYMLMTTGGSLRISEMEVLLEPYCSTEVEKLNFIVQVMRVRTREGQPQALSDLPCSRGEHVSSVGEGGKRGKPQSGKQQKGSSKQKGSCPKNNPRSASGGMRGSGGQQPSGSGAKKKHVPPTKTPQVKHPRGAGNPGGDKGNVQTGHPFQIDNQVIPILNPGYNCKDPLSRKFLSSSEDDKICWECGSLLHRRVTCPLFVNRCLENPAAMALMLRKHKFDESQRIFKWLSPEKRPGAQNSPKDKI